MAEQEALPHGAIATAEHQTAGKGRQGRTWLTPKGTAVALSLLLKPHWPTAHATWLTMIAGIAAVRALGQVSAVPVALKWPNDIIVPAPNGAGWRKLGGILLEGQMTAERLETAVVGLGLNINLLPNALPPVSPPATSLLAESGQWVARQPLITHLLCAFEELYESAEAGHSPHTAWSALLHTLGQSIAITTADGQPVTEGVAERTTAEGHLCVRDDHGRLHIIPAGDVSLRTAGL